MKKFLEISIEDDGRMKFSTDFENLVQEEDEEIDNRKMDESERMLKKVISGCVECTWGERRDDIFPLIRILGMAEMMSCVNPCMQAEEMWSTMMFSIIPEFDKLESKYGIRELKGNLFGLFPSMEKIVNKLMQQQSSKNS